MDTVLKGTSIISDPLIKGTTTVISGTSSVISGTTSMISGTASSVIADHYREEFDTFYGWNQEEQKVYLRKVFAYFEEINEKYLDRVPEPPSIIPEVVPKKNLYIQGKE